MAPQASSLPPRFEKVLGPTPSPAGKRRGIHGLQIIRLGSLALSVLSYLSHAPALLYRPVAVRPALGLGVRREERAPWRGRRLCTPMTNEK